MKAENVSDEQLMIDIENTEKEVKAYRYLSMGFDILANLPENVESGASSELRFRAMKHRKSEEECMDFLEEIKKIAIERNLI